MELQVATEPEPSAGAGEGKAVSSGSPGGGGRVSSPASVRSAPELRDIRRSEPNETRLTYRDRHGLCCQLEGGVGNRWQC